MIQVNDLVAEPQTVYALHNTGLGDHITSLSLMHWLGLRASRESVLVSTWNFETDFTKRCEALMGIMAPFMVKLTPAVATHKIDPWFNWFHPLKRAVINWSPQNAANKKIACYQFDGLSAGDKKNMPQAEETQLLNTLRMMGYECVQLGAGVSLTEAAVQLSTCSFFVGVDSGFSHLAHSVGCPVFLYRRFVELETTHSMKQYVQFTSPSDFIYRAGHYLRLLARK